MSRLEELAKREAELLALNARLDARLTETDTDVVREVQAALEPRAEEIRSPLPRRPLTPPSPVLSPAARNAAAASAVNRGLRTPTTPERVVATPERPGSSTTRNVTPRQRKPSSRPSSRPSSAPRRSPSHRQQREQQLQEQPPRNAERIADVLPNPPLDDGDGIDEMGPEATIRFQRARLQVLQDELRKAASRERSLQAEVKEARDALTAASSEGSGAQNRLVTVEQELRKQTKIAEEATEKAAKYHAELNSLRKEREAAAKAARQAESERSVRDVRLHRAQEDAEKLREEVRSLRAAAKDGDASVREQCRALEGDVRRLERQKTELLNAFKKQLKLIDVLKRQKVHIEAARMLAFSEEEFAKTLEAGR